MLLVSAATAMSDGRARRPASAPSRSAAAPCPEPRGKDGSATALMLSADPLDRRMVSQLNLVPMNEESSEESSTEAGRTLEIFLDLLVALSTDSHSYLLAEGYEGALTVSGRSLRETLLDLTKRLTDDEAQSSGGVRLREMLAELGASAPSSCTP